VAVGVSVSVGDAVAVGVAVAVSVDVAVAVVASAEFLPLEPSPEPEQPASVAAMRLRNGGDAYLLQINIVSKKVRKITITHGLVWSESRNVSKNMYRRAESSS